MADACCIWHDTSGSIILLCNFLCAGKGLHVHPGSCVELSAYFPDLTKGAHAGTSLGQTFTYKTGQVCDHEALNSSSRPRVYLQCSGMLSALRGQWCSMRLELCIVAHSQTTCIARHQYLPPCKVR